MRTRKHGDGVAYYIPEEKHVEIADSRLSGFLRAWASELEPNIHVLMRSCYLQGLNDMSEVVIRMQEQRRLEIEMEVFD